MEASRFDRLAKMLSSGGTRRGVLHLVAALPFGSGLAALLDGDAAGKSRRKRRKRRHKHGMGRRRKHHNKKKCKANSTARTCAGKCGPVKNNCEKTIDCGPCECDPPCGICETCSDDLTCEACEPCCDEVCCAQANAICHASTGACCVPDAKAQTCADTCGDVVNNCGVTVDCGDCTCDGGCPICRVCDKDTGDCVPDQQQEGDPCGEEGQFCQADGACTCSADPDTCAPFANACQAAVCGGEVCVTTPIACDAPPTCRTAEGATCDPLTGCSYPSAAVGTSCNAPEGGTTEAVCQANGRCCVPSGGNPGGGDTFCLGLNCCSGVCRSQVGVPPLCIW